MKLSVHQALSKLKILESRITGVISRTSLNNDFKVIGISQYNKPISTQFKDVKSMRSTLSANHQSYKDLLEQLYKIKNSIDKSNAKTKIQVAGKSYTVLEALSYKNFIIPKEQVFLDILKSNLNALQGTYDNIKANVEKSLPEDVSADTIMSLIPKIEDPNNISTYVNNRQEEINNFLSEIDDALVLSNVNTFIEI